MECIARLHMVCHSGLRHKCQNMLWVRCSVGDVPRVSSVSSPRSDKGYSGEGRMIWSPKLNGLRL